MTETTTHDSPERDSDGAVLFHGYRIYADGRIGQKRSPGRLVAPYTVKGGYRRVTLNLPTGRAGKLVHVLVAEAFLGPKPEGMEVNHKDGDKNNNAASNLEYVSPSANVRHSLRVLGVERARGEASGTARLTEAAVRDIRTRAAAARDLMACVIESLEPVA